MKKLILFFTISFFLLFACQQSFEREISKNNELQKDLEVEEEALTNELEQIETKPKDFSYEAEQKDEQDFQNCVDVEKIEQSNPSLWETYSYLNESPYPYTPQTAIKQNSSAVWTLTNVDDMAGWEFTGIAELTGWIIEAPFYGNAEPEPHFCILEKDFINLPKGVFRRTYRLYHLRENQMIKFSEEEIQNFLEYTKENL